MVVKNTLKIIALVLLGLFVALAILWFQLDAIVENALESNLSQVLGVPTRIEDFRMDRFAGKVHLDNLTIDNPSGFSRNKIIQVKNIEVELQPWSVLQPTIKVNSLVMSKIKLKFEQNLSSNNILKLIQNVQEKTGHSNQTEFSAQFSLKKKKFIVQSANLNNIEATINLSPLGKILPFGGLTEDIKIDIPDIALKDVTSENATAVLEGTLNDLVNDLLKNLAGGFSKQKSKFPLNSDSGETDGILGDILKSLPF